MRESKWYFTLINNDETAIEYVVICIDDEFDRYIQQLRDSRTDIINAFGSHTVPALSVRFPNIALVKTLPISREEDIEESIDNSWGMWAEMPLQPVLDLLHSSGQLTTAEILGLLRESEVDGSSARLCMVEQNLVYVIINPGDSNESIDTEYISDKLLPFPTTTNLIQ